MALSPFSLPEANKAYGSGTPWQDMDQVLNCLFSTGAVYNVLGNGADPTGNTDSTAAIQAVLTSLPSSGGTVFFPAGTYKISSALSVPSYAILQGAGTHATKISQITIGVHGLTSVDQNGQMIRDMTIVGPGDINGAGNGVNIAVSVNNAVAGCVFENLVIEDFGNEGFYAEDLIQSRWVGVEVQNCAENGFNIINGTSLSFTDCYANGVSGRGYSLDGVSYSSLSGCASDFGQVGYYLESCRAIAVTGCGFESQTINGMEITGCNSVTLASCESYANPNIGFWVTGSSTDVVLTACQERNPAGGATASFQVDSGSTAVLIAPDYVTALSLASGTTNLITTSGSAQVYGGLFGDGSDGALTLNGTNTYPGMGLTGSQYTLTRDIFATSISISGGILLKPAAFRIFCAGPVTNAGTISANGNNATGAAAGGATGSGATTGGRAGGNGSTTNGSAASAVGGGYAGAGGNGGAGGTGTGGTGATGTAASPVWYKTPYPVLLGSAAYASSTLLMAGGQGGGGGGGDNTSSGGGGGGGGSTIIILAWSLVNTGTMSANGGNGANGVAGSSGGGGGGGGGLIVAYTLTAWTEGTATVTGGSPGNGLSAGVNGIAGGTGVLQNIIIQ